MQRYTLQQLSRYTKTKPDTLYRWITRNHIPYTLNDYGQVTVRLGDMRDYKPRVNRLWYAHLAFQGIDAPTGPKGSKKPDNFISRIQAQETGYNPLAGLTARID